MVQTSMFFQETKASLLKFIWFHFKTTTKKMLVLFYRKIKPHKPSGTLEFDLKGNSSNNFSQISHIQQKSTRPLFPNDLRMREKVRRNQ